jgi:hypothetical protein
MIAHDNKGPAFYSLGHIFMFKIWKSIVKWLLPDPLYFILDIPDVRHVMSLMAGSNAVSTIPFACLPALFHINNHCPSIASQRVRIVRNPTLAAACQHLDGWQKAQPQGTNPTYPQKGAPMHFHQLASFGSTWQVQQSGFTLAYSWQTSQNSSLLE